MNLSFLTCIVVMGVGAYQVIQGTMTFGLMMAAIQLMGNLAQPIHVIADNMSKIKGSKGILEELICPRAEKKKGLTLGLPIERIELKDVRFSYGDLQVINRYNQVFEVGKRYALCGESGRGKTTILKFPPNSDVLGVYTKHINEVTP